MTLIINVHWPQTFVTFPEIDLATFWVSLFKVTRRDLTIFSFFPLSWHRYQKLNFPPNSALPSLFSIKFQGRVTTLYGAVTDWRVNRKPRQKEIIQSSARLSFVKTELTLKNCLELKWITIMDTEICGQSTSKISRNTFYETNPIDTWKAR